MYDDHTVNEDRLLPANARDSCTRNLRSLVSCEHCLRCVNESDTPIKTKRLPFHGGWFCCMIQAVRTNIVELQTYSFYTVRACQTTNVWAGLQCRLVFVLVKTVHSMSQSGEIFKMLAESDPIRRFTWQEQVRLAHQVLCFRA